MHRPLYEQLQQFWMSLYSLLDLEVWRSRYGEILILDLSNVCLHKQISGGNSQQIRKVCRSWPPAQQGRHQALQTAPRTMQTPPKCFSGAGANGWDQTSTFGAVEARWVWPDGFDQKQVLKHPKDPKSFSRSWYLVRAGLQLPTLHNWCMMRMIHGSLPSLNSTGHKSVMKMSEVEPVSAETMGHQAAPLQRREASLHRQVSYLEQNLSSQEPAEAWAIGSQPHKRSYWNITCIILQWYELDTQQMSGCHWNEDQSHGSHGAISMHHLPSQSQANATILRAPWCRGMRW